MRVSRSVATQRLARGHGLALTYGASSEAECTIHNPEAQIISPMQQVATSGSASQTISEFVNGVRERNGREK